MDMGSNPTPGNATVATFGGDTHLQWCKDRALKYLDRGDITNALASFFSDMSKDPSTADHGGLKLGAMLMLNGHLNTVEKVREHIVGYH